MRTLLRWLAYIGLFFLWAIVVELVVQFGAAALLGSQYRSLLDNAQTPLALGKIAVAVFLVWWVTRGWRRRSGESAPALAVDAAVPQRPELAMARVDPRQTTGPDQSPRRATSRRQAAHHKAIDAAVGCSPPDEWALERLWDKMELWSSSDQLDAVAYLEEIGGPATQAYLVVMAEDLDGEVQAEAAAAAGRVAGGVCEATPRPEQDAPDPPRLDPQPERAEQDQAEFAETIRALAQLRDDGLLTDAEYESKKSEILERL